MTPADSLAFEPVSWALSLVGSPWLSGGREQALGLDCWGLVRVVYERCLGIELPSYPHIGADAPRDIARQMKRESINRPWVEVSAPQEWAVVGLTLGKTVHHVGIWIDGSVLHSVPASGVVHLSPQSLRMMGLTCKQFWIYDQRPPNQ